MAITAVESICVDHLAQAQEMLQNVMKALQVGFWAGLINRYRIGIVALLLMQVEDESALGIKCLPIGRITP